LQTLASYELKSIKILTALNPLYSNKLQKLKLVLIGHYWFATPKQATCTGLSEVLHGQVSHNRFTRLLSSGRLDSKCVWKQAKPLVDEMVDSGDCVVVGIDDTIQEKPHSRENELNCWHSIKTLVGKDRPLKVWLRGMDNPVLLLKQVFKNEDGSQGVRYLVASDLTLEASQMIGIYQKRWKTEEYHKSIKQCSSLGRSAAHTSETQQAHCIAAIINYVKLEKLNFKNRMNHFALKSQIWVEATRHALQSMSKLSTSPEIYAFLTT